ncbi:MAG: RNA pseudouridine synthase [Patescibacteria group bacterium]|nr:RNA pseudouridine synthase [Patescibacteria group bacterium]MDD5164708.1 RNA pseudouridine synthase [Patescibacteria group bacterium]MDD5534184.1 RNA pseudouridine synthase [Patescibacteria group bacterium]
MGVDFFLKPNIIFKDKDYLIIEKPSGLLVHPTKHQKENTLANWLIENYPEIKDINESERPGIVHRLDQNVSGLMIIARNQKSFEYFIDQFKNSRVKKEYLALVCGRPSQKKGTIELPIGRTKKGKLVVVQSKKNIKISKPAITEYEVVQEFPKFTLLKLRPFTGRTHQIRLHLQSIGCPIVGDKQHSKAKTDLDRIFLHAGYLGFYDLNNQWQEFKSDLPKELKDFLNKKVCLSGRQGGKNE